MLTQRSGRLFGSSVEAGLGQKMGGLGEDAGGSFEVLLQVSRRKLLRTFKKGGHCGN